MGKLYKGNVIHTVKKEDVGKRPYRLTGITSKKQAMLKRTMIGHGFGQITKSDIGKKIVMYDDNTLGIESGRQRDQRIAGRKNWKCVEQTSLSPMLETEFDNFRDNDIDIEKKEGKLLVCGEKMTLKLMSESMRKKAGKLQREADKFAKALEK